MNAATTDFSAFHQPSDDKITHGNENIVPSNVTNIDKTTIERHLLCLPLTNRHRVDRVEQNRDQRICFSAVLACTEEACLASPGSKPLIREICNRDINHGEMDRHCE